VITVPKRYRRTDRRTILWHHRWVKIGKLLSVSPIF